MWSKITPSVRSFSRCTERGGGSVQGGRLGGAVGGMVVAAALASTAVCARLYRGRRVPRRTGTKTLHLVATTEDTRPMLRPGGECQPATVLEEEDEEDMLARLDDEEAPMMGKEEEEEEEDQVFRVVVDPLSCSAGLVRHKQEAASALHEMKIKTTAAKKAEAASGEKLHIGEWMQLVPQECEDSLARKLQHVAGDKNHREQQQQQQQLGEWLQHMPGDWVVASSLHEPLLHFPAHKSPGLWIRPPPQESYCAQSGSLSLESNGNGHNPVKFSTTPVVEKCSIEETSYDGDGLAENYEDWRVKFSPNMKLDSLPKTLRPQSIHRSDFRYNSLRMPAFRLLEGNYNHPPGASHQPGTLPEDANNNNNNSIDTSRNTQHETIFDTNSNFNRNSLFLPPNTIRDDLSWSLPHPLRTETRRQPQRQVLHEQEGSHPPAMLQRLQRVAQPRSRSTVGGEQPSSSMMSEHELAGQEQAAKDSPRSMWRLRFSEETIL
ncbi:hypothetical protein E2C01_007871 [Portunus trituberculatus]|uniref:Uncharacterized protein n=1 Tax=Portunus trituberculatus TaxID=210409 RepID=A0A5B7D0U3_PORTR|nr:hypothetical protein [Portunus trituberculatus]